MYDENFVKEQQQQIQDGYRQLGERFYAANRDNVPEEYAEVFAGIQACEKAIEECEAEQRRAKELEEKGLVLCPFCGEELVSRSVFCNFCGKRLSDFRAEKEEEAAPAAQEPKTEAAQAPAVCSSCGAVLEKDCAFCIECGAPVAKTAPAVRVCAKCGFQTTDAEAMFCNNCGARLDNADKPAAAAAQEKHCPFCGFCTTDADVLFCIECGSRMV